MYFNSRINLDGLSLQQIIKKLKLYQKLGFHQFILDQKFSDENGDCSPVTSLNKDYQNKIHRIISIVDPPSISELKKLLSKITSLKRYIIAIESDNKDILAFAANDSRILVIQATKLKYMKILDDGIVSLLKQSKKYVCFSLIGIFKQQGLLRSRNLREISKFLSLFKNKEYILIYGDDEDDNLFLRGPRELISVLNSIFDIPILKAKSFFRDNPLNLVNYVERKLSSNTIEEGLRIIKKIEKI